MPTYTSLTPQEVQMLEEMHQHECKEQMEELLAELTENVEFQEDGTAIEYDQNGEILAIWW